MQRREMFYEGHVQGVGFRYRTVRIAEQFQVTGFVRNLPDRRVQLVVEGDSAELDRFVGAVADELRDHIHRVIGTTCEATGEFSGFDIRH